MLHLAARAGGAGCVRELVDGWSAQLELRDDHGATALVLAAIKGRDAIVRYLLDKGACPSVRAVHKDGNVYDTAQGWARRLGHAKVLQRFADFETTATSPPRAHVRTSSQGDAVAVALMHTHA